VWVKVMLGKKETLIFSIYNSPSSEIDGKLCEYLTTSNREYIILIRNSIEIIRILETLGKSLNLKLLRFLYDLNINIVRIYIRAHDALEKILNRQLNMIKAITYARTWQELRPGMMIKSLY
jgi:hypothetical protein